MDALALALAAAVVHAAWNAGLAGSADTRATLAVALVAGAVLWAPVAALTWDVRPAAWPYVAASVAAELAYVALLAAAYARAQMSVVYPIARGAAPVLVLAAGGAASAHQAAGVAVVAAGVLAVRGPSEEAGRRDVGLALAVAATIATYTLIDKHGLRHAGAPPYLELVLGVSGVLYALALRAAGEPLRPALRPRTVLAGAGMFGAYGLTLAALRLAPAAAVAAVRETSVVFGVVLAALVLGERVTPGRFAGAVAVAAGVALVAS